jgi:A/G-specific adenine glycosylase
LADEMDVNDLPKGKLVKLREQVKHVLTHRIIYADFYLYEPENKPSLSPDYIWIKEDDLSRYAVPRLMEILFRSL